MMLKMSFNLTLALACLLFACLLPLAKSGEDEKVDLLLSGVETSEIDKLRKYIFEAYGKEIVEPYAHIPITAMRKGIAAYFVGERLLNEETEEMSVRSDAGRAMFEDLFEKRLAAPCQVVEDKLSSSMDTYEMIVENALLMNQVADPSFNWMVNVRICLEILFDKRGVMEDARRTLMTNGASGTRLRRVLDFAKEGKKELELEKHLNQLKL